MGVILFYLFIFLILGVFILYALSFFRSTFIKRTILKPQPFPKKLVLYALLALNLIFILSTIFLLLATSFWMTQAINESTGILIGIAIFGVFLSVFVLLITLPFIRKLRKG
jgi:hypothetical protein